MSAVLIYFMLLLATSLVIVACTVDDEPVSVPCCVVAFVLFVLSTAFCIHNAIRVVKTVESAESHVCTSQPSK